MSIGGRGGGGLRVEAFKPSRSFSFRRSILENKNNLKMKL